MSRPLEHAPAYLRAEIAYAVSHEGALHLEDVMHRRTRMVYEYADEALAALPEVARIVAGELGWSDARRDEEVAAYTAVALIQIGDSTLDRSLAEAAEPLLARLREASGG